MFKISWKKSAKRRICNHIQFNAAYGLLAIIAQSKTCLSILRKKSFNFSPPLIQEIPCYHCVKSVPNQHAPRKSQFKERRVQWNMLQILWHMINTFALATSDFITTSLLRLLYISFLFPTNYNNNEKKLNFFSIVERCWWWCGNNKIITDLWRGEWCEKHSKIWYEKRIFISNFNLFLTLSSGRWRKISTICVLKYLWWFQN